MADFVRAVKDTYIKKNLGALDLAIIYKLSKRVNGKMLNTMYPSLNIKPIVLKGTPFERGKIHGETLKPMISEVVERWKFRLQATYKVNPDDLIEQFIDDTCFVLAVEKKAPHLLEEVKGIGEGSGIDFNTIFAFQCLDELWWYPDRNKYGFVDNCSALGCFKEDDRPALLGQNMDIQNFYQGFETLLHVQHQDSQLESYVYTFAGMIGLCGVNNSSVGICCNYLRDLNTSTDGFPVSFIVRSVLGQGKLDGAVKFIHETKHASGQNYIIGGLEKLVSLECSANKVSQYIPYKGYKRIYHTNHPLVNDDLKVPTPEHTALETSHARFEYLKSRIKDPSKKISAETIKYILRSHEGPICVHNKNLPGGFYTFGSLVYELSPFPVLHLAKGPPCSNEYKEFKFN